MVAPPKTLRTTKTASSWLPDWFDASTNADLAKGGQTILNVTSDVLDAIGSKKLYKRAAKSTKQLNKINQLQLKQAANQAQGLSQLDAADEVRASQLAISKATANAAASGAGASDPTVEAIISSLSKQGGFNAMAALYDGETEAYNYKTQAVANDYEAKTTAAGYKANAKDNSGWFRAAGDLLSGGASFIEKYG